MTSQTYNLLYAMPDRPGLQQCLLFTHYRGELDVASYGETATDEWVEPGDLYAAHFMAA